MMDKLEWLRASVARTVCNLEYVGLQSADYVQTNVQMAKTQGTSGFIFSNGLVLGVGCFNLDWVHVASDPQVQG